MLIENYAKEILNTIAADLKIENPKIELVGGDGKPATLQVPFQVKRGSVTFELRIVMTGSDFSPRK